MKNIWRIELKDGGIFKVIVANKSQLNRLTKVISDKKDLIKSFDNILNGLHDIKQFETIIYKRG